MKYDIHYFELLEDAFDYQNKHGGTLYTRSRNPIEYEITEYLAEIDEAQECFVVVEDFVRDIIERPCFKIKE
jgi:hypothetical protein